MVIAGLGGVRLWLMKYWRSSASAGNGRGGMARAGRDGVKLLVQREKVVQVAQGPTARQRADEGRVKTRKRGTGAAGRGGAILGNAAGNVRAGRDQVRFYASITAWALTGKTEHAVGVGGVRIRRGTTIVPVGIVSAVGDRK